MIVDTTVLMTLDNDNVWSAEEFVAAREGPVEGCAQTGTGTVQQFAEACADIRVTAPAMGGLDARPAHLVELRGRLVPPPGLGGNITRRSCTSAARSRRWTRATRRIQAF